MTSVSSNEARNNLGKLLRLVTKDDTEVVIKIRGEPTAVLISYAEYEELNRLKKLLKRQQALEKLRTIRQRVQESTTELSDQERYQLAGFGEPASQEIMLHEQQISPAP